MEPRSSSPRIFLSFSYEDRELAERLAGALRHRGAYVWTGLEQIRLGDSLSATIESGIRGSDVFLILVTPHAVASAWVIRELEYAVNAQHGRGRIKVVPVRVDGVPMPPTMQGIVWLEATSSRIELAADGLLAPIPSPERESLSSVRTEVRRMLTESSVEWDQEVALGGVRADFLIITPDDRWIVLDVKATEPSLVEAVKARTEASRLREAAGADAAFIVFPKIQEGFPEQGIVGLKDLRKVLAGDAGPSLGATPRRALRRRSTSKTILAAMPFAPEFDDVFWVAMTGAAKQVDGVCVRLDQDDYVGDVVSHMKKRISTASALIADLTGANPNVMYEVGFAHALDVPAIHICSSPLTELPFDVQGWSTIRYDIGQTYALTAKLTGRLRNTLPA